MTQLYAKKGMSRGKLTTPPPLHANGPPMPMDPPSFPQFAECEIVCLMPNSPPCFALTKFDYCCAPKQIKGLVRVF